MRMCVYMYICIHVRIPVPVHVRVHMRGRSGTKHEGDTKAARFVSGLRIDKIQE